MKLIRCLNCVRFLSLTAVVALASPLLAQKGDDSIPSVATDTPPSMQKSVAVMVELKDAPAGVAYATALKQAQAQYDQQRAYALQHPSLKTSQALLKQTPTNLQISSQAASQVRTAVSRIDQAQRNLLPALTSSSIGGQVMFRAQRAYNGIAMIVSPDKIASIAAMAGVKAVHPMNPKYLVTTFSDIDFLNTRPAWTTGPFGTHGENIKVGDIDSGLDYIHRNFGGSGAAADYTATTDTSAIPNSNYPTPKIPGGIDLVGDAYNAASTAPPAAQIPHPDNNPLDCGGHGTATASLIAGFGETNAGFTYSGTYDAVNPSIASLKIPPGFAPNAKLYPIRVFGCGGSTNVVVQAIEWAMDPNGDGNFSDKMDVINMSLGANNGFADDPDDVAATIAANAGIIICSAAGNAGDSYYIHSSPAAAAGTLGVAATFNDQAGFIADSNVTGNAPPAIAGNVYYSIKGSASASIPGGGVTGNVVYAVPPDANTNGGNPGGPGLSNAAQVSGNIVIINRGTTTFVDKVTKGLNAGAIAVIVNNFNNPGADPIVMATGGQPAGVDVMITRTDRDTIVTAAGGNPANADGSGGGTGFDPATGVPTTPVNVTINNDNAVVTHGGAAPDTMPTYSARGPRLPDSATKPDISAPAEVTAVATSEADPAATGKTIDASSGTRVQNFNGTSSATPHVAGEMSLLKQLHPTWSVQELLALACNTSTHDLFTTTAHTTQFGVGRVGAGRVDVGLAAAASVVAYNGSDPNLQGVSFGVVEVPVDGSTTLTKNITVTNKGATNITYNTSVVNNPALAGATFTVSPANFTVNAGTSTTVTATLTATGSTLKHAREGSVNPTQGGSTPTNGNPRQWLAEAGAYAVLTPTDASPVLRVELYAAPKPASGMHATVSGVVPTAPNTGSFNINLTGSSVNTGASLGNGFDIVSLVKAFEGQYASPLIGPSQPTDRFHVKYAGVTSDALTRGVSAARIVFGVETFGNNPEPGAQGGSDREIFIDTGDGAGGGPDGIPDFALFLTRNGTGQENVYLPALVKLHAGTAATTGFFTNGLNAAVADTNAYNNTCVTFPVNASSMVDTANGYPAVGTVGHTLFTYQVVTFDRNGNEVEETPVMVYDIANPGLEVDNVGSLASVVFSSSNDHVENFMFKDLPSNFIPVNYNGTNFQNVGSLGVLLFHMHNAEGSRGELVAFRKPTVTGFSPTSGPVGTNVTITGTNFNSGTGVTFFNNKTATVTVITSNTLIAKVPAGAITGPIRAFNAAGSSTAPGNFTVTP